MKKQISVVVPVYGSASTLPQLVIRIEKALQPMTSSFEILLVNDGSPDDSWEVIQKLSLQFVRVGGINLMRNYGQHAALAAGIRICQGEQIVTLDDDLQTPPEEMPKLLAKLEEGFDLVYGTRSTEKNGFWRNQCSKLGKKALAKLLGIRVATSLSSYKAFHHSLRQVLLLQDGPVVFLDALLCWGTSRVGSVEVRHEARRRGVSGYNWPKLVRHYANMTTSFSQVPLKIASLLGISTMLLGVGLLGYVLFSYWFRDVPVQGFTFVAASVTIFSGTQLFILGIMGEYLARMHQNLIGTPAYLIRHTVGQVFRDLPISPESTTSRV